VKKEPFDDLQILPGKPLVETTLLLASDLVSFLVAQALVALARSLLFPQRYTVIFDPAVIRTIIFVTAVSVTMLAARGMYPGRGRSSVTELKQTVETISLAYVLLGVAVFILGMVVGFSRSVFLLSWFFVVLILPVNRFLIRKSIAMRPWWGEPVVIIGKHDDIRDAAVRLQGAQRLGLRPVAGLAVDMRHWVARKPVLILPWSLDAQQKILDEGVNTAILAISTDELHRDHPHVFRQIGQNFQRTIFLLDQNIYSIMMSEAVDLMGRPAIISHQSLLSPARRLAKRVSELLIGLVVMPPLLLVSGLAALWIKLDSPGPVFYTQERIGRDGKPFNLVKFRTMVMNADEVLEKVLQDPQARQEWDEFHKLNRDPRITRAGKWIRLLSLDELPQIINVMRGEMTIVGPRPLVQEEIDSIGDAAETVLRVLPGITGWWQVNGRNNLSFEERTRLDLYYVINWSLWLDLFILIKTVWVIFFLR